MDKKLNQGLRFEELPAECRKSFSGRPRRVQVAPGTGLYRFVWYSRAGVDPSADLPSPFWITKATYVELRRLWSETEIPLPDLSRALLALAYDFTPIVSGVMSVQLRCRAVGLIGQIAEQRLLALRREQRHRPARVSEELRKIVAPGGLDQIYLPNLEWGDFFNVRLELLSRKGQSGALFGEARRPAPTAP